MAFLQSDIDPLYLREKHLRVKVDGSTSISATASASTTSVEDTDHFTEMDLDDHHHQEGAMSTAVKRFFESCSTSSSSSKTVIRRSTFSRKENLDRLVSFYL